MRYLITWVDKYGGTSGEYIAKNKSDAKRFLSEDYVDYVVKDVLNEGEFIGTYDVVKMFKLKDLL